MKDSKSVWKWFKKNSKWVRKRLENGSQRVRNDFEKDSRKISNELWEDSKGIQKEFENDPNRVKKFSTKSKCSKCIRKKFENDWKEFEKIWNGFESFSKSFRFLFASVFEFFANPFRTIQSFSNSCNCFRNIFEFLRFLDCIYTSMYILQRQASMVLLTLNSNKYQFYLYSPSRNISVSYLYESRKCIAHNYKFVVLVANLASEINAPIGCVGWT